MQILISGASVAGPVLAYWLRRHGFTPTVVERAPALRKTGGHAVDLFRPALDIIERMGLSAAVQARSTGTDRMTLLRAGERRGIEVDLTRLMAAISDRHLEIMRDDLSEIFHEATRDDVEYLFGDSIGSLTEVADGVEVTFERGPARRFDLVIGADGLHSNVRRLVFGDERQLSTYIGAYLAVVTLPNYLGLTNHLVMYGAPGRAAALYSARHMDDARAVFLWRSPRPLDVQHRDVARQKDLLRAAFAGVGWEVPRIMEELERTPAFYFDSITQLRMDTWSRGRVSLAGDAGYSPGPAVGGSTSLAVVGAYTLAGELAAAGGDHRLGFVAYERALSDYVKRSRVFALRAVRHLIPDNRFELWAQGRMMWLLSHLPGRLARAVTNLSRQGVRLHDAVAVADYARPETGAGSGWRETSPSTEGAPARNQTAMSASNTRQRNDEVGMKGQIGLP
jgi:2-polyprenyl-6-methoxyphenol hydroxylase-like FAD-dependent oxidoreductase